MTKGAIFKRCGCRDTTGRRLEQHCPRLPDREHGSWYFHASASNLLGRPEPIRRGRYPSQAAARRTRHAWLVASETDRVGLQAAVLTPAAGRFGILSGSLTCREECVMSRFDCSVPETFNVAIKRCLVRVDTELDGIRVQGCIDFIRVNRFEGRPVVGTVETNHVAHRPNPRMTAEKLKELPSRRCGVLSIVRIDETCLDQSGQAGRVEIIEVSGSADISLAVGREVKVQHAIATCCIFVEAEGHPPYRLRTVAQCRSR
jgi:hypothetical protein